MTDFSSIPPKVIILFGNIDDNIDFKRVYRIFPFDYSYGNIESIYCLCGFSSIFPNNHLSPA